MEKETSTRSTPEKKAADKKKTTTKKTDVKSSTGSTATKTPKIKAASKGSAAETTQAATSGKTAKQTTPSTRRKNVAPKDLIFKKFDTWTPDKIFRLEPTQKSREDFTSPPFVSGKNAAEVDRIKKLLFKKFDLTASSEAANEHKKAGVSDSKSAETPITFPAGPKQTDPVATTLKFLILGIALLIALTIKVSISNRANYYLIPMKAGIEIWQGIFAPMGRERLFTLPDAEAPESIQGTYTKQQIYPFVFNYYVKKADELLGKPGMPDFEGIKIYLNKAKPYAVTEKLRKVAAARLNNIDIMILLYKTDVAASKEALADYEAALEYLKEAAALDVDGSNSALIKQKTESIQAAMADLEQAKQEEPAVGTLPK
jgi:hypothetical protein